MQIKTVSFLSGKVLIGNVDGDGNWLGAMFVKIVQQPETGERTAMFSPVAPGRESQDLSREEYLQMINGSGGFIGPSEAAKGLKVAYENFVGDQASIKRCVKAHTTECGPSDKFLGKVEEGKPFIPEKSVEGNVISATFCSSQKKIKKLEDIE